MLNSITIKNFRSITELSLDNLGQINLLFGENNCGKSSVLEAIFCFAAQDSNAPLTIRNFRKIYSNNGNSNIFEDYISNLFTNFNTDNTISISGYTNNNRELLEISCEERGASVSDDYTASSYSETVIDGITLKYSNDEITSTACYDASDSKHKSEKLDRGALSYIAIFINQITTETILKDFKKIQKSKKIESLIKLLKTLDQNIIDLRLDENNKILVNTQNGPDSLVPIEYMGDGIVKALSIAIAILNNHDIILIDEIENGLHHKSQEIIWKAIIQWAKEYNIQFFITTHSYEMIERISDIITDNNNEKMLTAYRIENNNGKFKAINIEADSLQRLTDEKWEIR